MSQHDYNIANQSGSGLRSDLNSALSAIATQNSGSTAPSTTYPYQPWADSTSGLLYRRNSANSGWILDLALSGTHLYTYYLTQRVDNDFLALVGGYTGGANIELNGPSSASASNAFFDAAAHYFRSVDGATRYATLDSNGLAVGALSTADAQINIGKGATGNRYAYLDLIGDTTYSDYGLRIIRNNTGANATSEIQHRGNGYFGINAQDAGGGGGIALSIGGVTKLQITGTTGHVSCPSGVSGSLTRSTEVPTTSGTSVSFTSLPSWVKRISLHLTGVSLSGGDSLLVRLSTGGTFATTGYDTASFKVNQASGVVGTSNSNHSGATLPILNASSSISGTYTFVNITGNTWVGSYSGVDPGNACMTLGAVTVALSGTLDGIRLLPTAGNFDAGTVNITYQG